MPGMFPHSSPQSSLVHTCLSSPPITRITSENASIQNTPSPIFNPFETDLERLKHPVVTPGIFKKTVDSTPGSKKLPFKWDIEQQAILAPQEFGDVTARLERQHRTELKTFHHSQDYIDSFFQSSQIAPSPFTEPVQKTNILANIEEESKAVRNVSCQTDLHIPFSVDLKQLLKQYVLSESQSEELNRGDSFSNASLRRKLFVDQESDSSDSLLPEVQPIASRDLWQSPPLMDIASSSPVNFSGSEFLTQRRCSFSPPHLSNTSPNVSPISSASRENTSGTPPSPRSCLPQTSPRSRLSQASPDIFHVSNRGLETESDEELSYMKVDAADVRDTVTAGALDTVTAGALDTVTAGALDTVTAGALDTVTAGALGTVTAGALNTVTAGALDTAAEREEVEEKQTVHQPQKPSDNSAVHSNGDIGYASHTVPSHQSSEHSNAGCAGDTGYASQITHTFCTDTSSLQDIRNVAVNWSLQRTEGENAEWKPSIASTPNKGNQLHAYSISCQPRADNSAD